MLEFDKEFYKVDPLTGVRSLAYVIHPSIHNNQLGPLVLGTSIKINILRNSDLLVRFTYDVIKPIPEGKQLYASAIFELTETSSKSCFNSIGEIITCSDTQIEQKIMDSFIPVFVDRPRNIRRSNIGPFVVGDEIRVEFLYNDNILDSFDYTPTSPLPSGKVLSAVGQVDFVELTGA